MFERVLVATDGSECGNRAARAGVELAATFDAEVDVIVASGPEIPPEDARRVAEEAVAVEEAPVSAVRAHVVDGDPRRAIVGTAEDVDADIVVLGRHGHTGVGERLLGSVTNRVLRSCDRPVLAVPARGPDPGNYGDVLVTTDASDPARAAIRPGVAVAAAYDATLHLLRVVDVQRAGGLFSAGGVEREFVDRLVEDASEDLAAFAAACEEAAPDAGLDVERTVRTGTPAEEIAAYVEETGVDVISMGSVGEGSLAGQLLGSTTDRVLRTANVPALVVGPRH